MIVHSLETIATFPTSVKIQPMEQVQEFLAKAMESECFYMTFSTACDPRMLRLFGSGKETTNYVLAS